MPVCSVWVRGVAFEFGLCGRAKNCGKLARRAKQGGTLKPRPPHGPALSRMVDWRVLVAVHASACFCCDGVVICGSDGVRAKKSLLRTETVALSPLCLAFLLPFFPTSSPRMTRAEVLCHQFRLVGVCVVC
jgi:hypothetical protein